MARKTREIKFTKEQARDIGRRFDEVLKRSGATNAKLAKALDCTTAQISKMRNHGQGSLAAFTIACSAIDASLDYVVLGRFPLADKEFAKALHSLLNKVEGGTPK